MKRPGLERTGTNMMTMSADTCASVLLGLVMFIALPHAATGRMLCSNCSTASSTSHAPPTHSPRLLHEAGAVHNYILDIVQVTAAPDGFPRQVLAVNGTIPAPTITVYTGDIINATVINRLNRTTTIHWHGMRQHGTPDMDGTPGISQDAIAPGAAFTYTFVAAAPGTYWYHSHNSVEYVDGIRGALIVRDPSDTRADDKVVMLMDWYHALAVDLLHTAYLTPDNTKGDEPVPVSALINGLGCGVNNNTGSCPNPAHIQLSAPAPLSCNELFDHDPLVQARAPKLRVIGAAAFAVFEFSVDGHLMKVVGVDAVAVVPSATLAALRVNAGQRYDIIMCRKDVSPLPVWVRAEMEQKDFDDDANSVENAPFHTATAILSYNNSHAGETPTTAGWEQSAAEQQDGSQDTDTGDQANRLLGSPTAILKPLMPVSPPKPTRVIDFRIDIMADSHHAVVLDHLNNVSFAIRQLEAAPKGQSLLAQARRSGALHIDSAMPDPGVNVVSLELGEVVQLVIYNHYDNQHAMHLHGHTFWVMGAGNENDGPFNATDPQHTLNELDPLRRDTATINAFSWLVLRFVADNPGIWLFHCHNDWHMAAGLAVVFAEGVEQLKSQDGNA